MPIMQPIRTSPQTGATTEANRQGRVKKGQTAPLNVFNDAFSMVHGSGTVLIFRLI